MGKHTDTLQINLNSVDFTSCHQIAQCVGNIGICDHFSTVLLVVLFLIHQQCIRGTLGLYTIEHCLYVSLIHFDQLFIQLLATGHVSKQYRKETIATYGTPVLIIPLVEHQP